MAHRRSFSCKVQSFAAFIFCLLYTSGLDGIEFTVTNRSAHKVLVDGEWREPGEAVATLITAWNDEAGAYTAQTAADALPYGSASAAVCAV